MESFGTRLKREREQRGVALDEISLSTKIGTRFLRALEEEHFEQLPGGIFNKGFVRAYARHLGIDEEQAIADYLVASGAGQPEKKAEEGPAQVIPTEEAGNGEARVPWGMFAIALLLVALGLTIWGFHSRERQPENRAADSAPASQPASVPAPTTSASPSDHKQHSATGPAAATSAANPQPSSDALSAPTNQPPTTVPMSGAFAVLIKAREDSWLTITADGKEIMHNILAAPAEKSVEAQTEIVIRAGNVGAVDFSFNGKKLPLQGDYDEVKTLVFDANGLRPAAATTQPAQTPP